jgi:iron complex transport system ATP-binding protein
MKEFLSLQNVKCGYRNGFRLEPVSFGISKGVFAGIIGPNGSGKSTLFKGIAGDLPLLDGSVMLDGVSLQQMGVKQRARQLAVVSQFTEVGDITVEDYVLMGRLPYREPFRFFESDEDVNIAQHYMQLTDVFHLKDKRMHQLSGGEQQLAAIAQALTQQPRLLLLDEPTSHLDIMHQVQVLNLIQRLNQETGITVLMIIHDLNLAGEYCDYLIMMNKGQIHTHGTAEEVLTFSNIEQVYKTVVVTQTNPVSKKPAIFLVSDKVLRTVNSFQ